jgi:hypothetical protein
VEDLFQAHDGDGLLVAAVAGAGFYQIQDRLFLRVGHLFESKAFSRWLLFLVLHRNENPIHSFLVIEGVNAFALLFVGEQLKELLG